MAKAGKRLVLVDADCDAPNLHVLLHGETLEKEIVQGPPLANLYAVKPVAHGRWEDVCAFDAIEGVKVNPIRCIGCRVCELAAPQGGVRMEERTAGEIAVEELPQGPFLHGRLLPGEAGFGGFVYRLRAKAEEIAISRGIDLVLIDGSPGIGCPVIASVTGCDTVLIVTEATTSGWHDFLRVHDLCSTFGASMSVCINKCDVDKSICSRIEEFCSKRNLTTVGRIPYDESVMMALEAGRIVVDEHPTATASREIAIVAERIGML
jgi:MinD superfamily P-loop ATPase